MADIYKCAQCGKNREGRFTRRKGESSWGKGNNLPRWTCYPCLPLGQGRGEDETDVMAKKPTTKTTASPINAKLPSKEESLAVISPLQADVSTLVVTDEESYQKADYLLSRIGQARKTWGERMEKIIRPIRQGLDEIYALNREVDKPLESLDKAVRKEMTAFKTEERRLIREADEAKAREEQRLRDEAEIKERAAQTAATPQLRGRLSAQAARLTEQAETVAQQETPAPVQAARSSERVPEKVRVNDLGLFLQGILDGTIAPEAITVDQVWLNKQFRNEPTVVAAWPGVEKYEDIQIVRR